MKKIEIYTLKGLRKLYQKLIKSTPAKPPICETHPDRISDIIYDKLNEHKPCMISRFGANELLCLVTYMGIKENNTNLISFIKGKSKQWWWNEENLDNMCNGAGFFPKEHEQFAKFSELLYEDIKYVDILGSWLSNESHFLSELKNAIFVKRELQNPFFAKKPWTTYLEGKKVLVVHPFSETIKSQYLKRHLLFSRPQILPEFELKTVQAIQSIAGNSNPFKDWFEALEHTKTQMNKENYDICLIGAGAYGFHLAAHAKRMGKQSIHLGGSLQLLFGIKGKRWENPDYNPNYNYAALMNEHWVYPSEKDRPKNLELVEGGCYW